MNIVQSLNLKNLLLQTGIEENMLFPILLMQYHEYKNVTFNLAEKGILSVSVYSCIGKEKKKSIYKNINLSLPSELNELALIFLQYNKEKKLLNFTEKGFKFLFNIENVTHEDKKIIFHWILGSYKSNKENIEKLLFVEKIEQSLPEKIDRFINKKKL